MQENQKYGGAMMEPTKVVAERGKKEKNRANMVFSQLWLLLSALSGHGI
jgi:hypothetical protein